MLLPLDGAVCNSTEVNNSILAVPCQSKFPIRSRCTFWVTATSVHLGTYFPVIGRSQGGGGEGRGTEDCPLIVLFPE